MDRRREQHAMADAAAKARAVELETARRKAEHDEVAASHPTTYWEDKGALQHILAQAIGGFSQSLWQQKGGQGASPAMNALASVVEDDRQKKLNKWEKSKDAVAARRRDEADYAAKRAAELERIDRESMMNIDHIDRGLRTLAAKVRLPDVQQRIQELRDAAAAKQDEIAEKRLNEDYGREMKLAPRTKNINYDPVKGGGQKPLPLASREDINEAQARATDLRNIRQLQQDIKDHPEAFQHVADRQRAFGHDQAMQDQLNKVPFAGPLGVSIGRAIAGDKADSAAGYLDTTKHPKAPDILTGIENATTAKALAYGGVVRDSDVVNARNAAAMAARSPSSFIKYLDKLAEDRQKGLDALVGTKRGLHSISAISPPEKSDRASGPPTPSPGKGAEYKTSSSHGPGWVLGDEFFPDSEPR